MAKFIRRILLFSIPLPLFFVSAYWAFDRLVKTGLEDFRLPPGTHVLVMGDSHIEMSVDDDLLGGARNVAQNSEVFLITRFKLETLLKNHPQVDTVCLGASFHNFSDYFDKIAVNHTVLGRYFYVLPADVQFELIREVDNPPGFMLKSYLGWSACFLGRSGIADRVLGGYRVLDTDEPVKEATVEERIREQYYRDGALADLSFRNIKSFKAIAGLCRAKHVSLIILNTPLHPLYKSRIPRKFIDKYYSLIGEIGLELFEFEGLALDDGHFHPDGDHVNRKGAIPVTKCLKKFLEDGRNPGPGTSSGRSSL